MGDLRPGRARASPPAPIAASRKGSRSERLPDLLMDLLVVFQTGAHVFEGDPRVGIQQLGPVPQRLGSIAVGNPFGDPRHQLGVAGLEPRKSLVAENLLGRRPGTSNGWELGLSLEFERCPTLGLLLVLIGESGRRHRRLGRDWGTSGRGDLHSIFPLPPAPLVFLAWRLSAIVRSMRRAVGQRER